MPPDFQHLLANNADREHSPTKPKNNSETKNSSLFTLWGCSREGGEKSKGKQAGQGQKAAMTSPAVGWLGVEKLQGHFCKREDTPTQPGTDTAESLHGNGTQTKPLAGSSSAQHLPATPDIPGMSSTVEIRLRTAQRAESPLPAAGHALAGCAFREHKSLSEPSLGRGTLQSSPTARSNCPERSLPAAQAALPWVFSA